MEGSGPIQVVCGFFGGLFGGKTEKREDPVSAGGFDYAKDSKARRDDRRDDYDYARDNYSKLVTAGKTFTVCPIDEKDLAVAKEMGEEHGKYFDQFQITNSIFLKLAMMLEIIEQATEADNLYSDRNTVTSISMSDDSPYWWKIHLFPSKIRDVFFNPNNDARVAYRTAALNKVTDGLLQKCTETLSEYLLEGLKEGVKVSKDKGIVSINGRIFAIRLILGFEPIDLADPSKAVKNLAASKMIQTAALALFEDRKNVYPNHLKWVFPRIGIGTQFGSKRVWLKLDPRGVPIPHCIYSKTAEKPAKPFDPTKAIDVGVYKWGSIKEVYCSVVETPKPSPKTDSLPVALTAYIPLQQSTNRLPEGCISFAPPVSLPPKNVDKFVLSSEDASKILLAYINALQQSKKGFAETAQNHVAFMPPVPLGEVDADGDYCFTEDECGKIILTYFDSLVNKTNSK